VNVKLSVSVLHLLQIFFSTSSSPDFRERMSKPDKARVQPSPGLVAATVVESNMGAVDEFRDARGETVVQE